ncbi:hypothetical protein [Hyphomicrobium zavarzinii]|uniref:hypothetical protein n=1 Tax=Hyphomicrobium zavarzinii TaxID=48292 RepID=UPI00037F9BA7|nr:hypothetical protein [Hyphomicrobium zavarzinii]
MILSLDDIDKLRRSRPRRLLKVGELPNAVREALGLSVPDVHLSTESLEHINKDHPDVNDFDLLHLPFAIKNGLLLRENKKPSILLAFYKVPEDERYYIAAFKLAEKGSEIWLSSFYRAKKNQHIKLRRKATVLQERR